MMQARIEEYRKQGVAVVVVEAAILIEANWQSLVDEIWVTVTPEDTVIKRLKEQRGLDEEQTRARIRSQLANDERMKYVDVLINNNGDLDEIGAEVKALWDKLVE